VGATTMSKEPDDEISMDNVAAKPLPPAKVQGSGTRADKNEKNTGDPLRGTPSTAISQRALRRPLDRLRLVALALRRGDVARRSFS
jgi:hypothetical protein